jgi:MATE family multidrug resistance protein
VNLYFTSAGSAQGPLILAANTLLMQFFMIYSYMMDGFANAGEALSGRYLGAGDSRMLSLTVRHLFGWGGGVALLFTVAYLLGGTLLLRLLTSDSSVVVVAHTYLPWAVLIPVAGMAAFVWDGIFIGTTRSRGMLVSCFWAAVAFFVLWFVLSPLWGNHALWIALLTYLALRGLIQTGLWRMEN